MMIRIPYFFILLKRVVREDPQGGSGFYLVALEIFQGTDNIN